jgi:hypothetical protein
MHENNENHFNVTACPAYYVCAVSPYTGFIAYVMAKGEKGMGHKERGEGILPS